MDDATNSAPWQEEATTGAPAEPPLRTFLDGQSREALIDILVELAGMVPEVGRALAARQALAGGQIGDLYREIRALLAGATAEPRWGEHWDSVSPAADFREVRERLALLLHQGHADTVVELGDELLTAGIEQIGLYEGEGDGILAATTCLTVVFEALAQSTLPPAEQLYRAIALQLRDEYDLCIGSSVFWSHTFPVEAWGDLADRLVAELRSLPGSPGVQDFARSYRRERLSGWAIRALQEAGREAEVFALAEAEAEQNGTYVRLVHLLIDAGRVADAERWIGRGIAALAASAPGLAVQLREIQRDIWERAGDWARVAALRADEFFQQPTMRAFEALRAAAGRATVWGAVRPAALHSLEPGEGPVPVPRDIAGQVIPPWPLPASGLPPAGRSWALSFPALALLIAIAADERRPADVLHWYDSRRNVPATQRAVDDSLVADAVAEEFPERAITIWRALAEEQIAQTKPAAYLVAGDYLRKLRAAYARRDRLAEWRDYVATLRQDNRRKRRLVEVLDLLAAERIDAR